MPVYPAWTLTLLSIPVIKISLAPLQIYACKHIKIELESEQLSSYGQIFLV